MNVGHPRGGLGLPALEPHPARRLDDVERRLFETHRGRIRPALYGLLGQGVADDPGGRERVDLRGERPSSPQELGRCARRAAGRGGCGTAPGPRENRIGRVLCRAVPITGWSTSSKKPRNCELLEVRLPVRLHDLADGDARVPEAASTISSAARSRHHACRCSSMPVVRPRPGRPPSPASGRAAHAGSPERVAQRRPLLVGRDRDRHPGSRRGRTRRRRPSGTGSAAPRPDRGCRRAPSSAP